MQPRVAGVSERRVIIPCVSADIGHDPRMVEQTPVNGVIVTTWKCIYCHVEWRTR